MWSTRLRLSVALGTAVLLMTLTAGAWVLVDRTKRAASEAAEQSLQRIADVVSANVNRQLVQVDGALASIPNLLGTLVGQSGEVTPEAASRLLRDLSFQTFAFRNLMLARPDGTLWASGRPPARNQQLQVALRDYAANRSIGAANFAGPFRNALTGDWDVLLTRKVFLKGAGPLLSVAEVPVPLLESLLAEAGGEPGVRIRLQGVDGAAFAGQPHIELDTGHLDSRQAQPTAVTPAGSMTATRLTLFADLRVVVTASTKIAMAGWRRQRDGLLTALALTEFLVLSLAGALSLALRHHDRLEAERASARRLMEDAIEALSVGFVLWDREDRLVMCNQRYRNMYELSKELIKPGAQFEEIIRAGAKLGQYPEAGEDHEAFIRAAIAWHRSGRGDIERELPDGRWLLINETGTAGGGFVGVRIDITALKQAQADLAAANERTRLALAEVQQQNTALAERDQALRTQNLRFEAALANMSHGLLMVDAGQRMIVCNPRFQELFGLAAAVIPPGISMQAVFDSIKTTCFGAEAAEDVYDRQLALAADQRPGMFIATSGDGRALSVVQRPMADGGWVAIYEDVTDRQRAEGRIRFLAHHDELTGLPNRMMFRSQMIETLRTRNAAEAELACFYLDLDKFKNVNDTLGHQAGDALLVAVGRRLRACLKREDIVARLGGDEFAVVSSAPGMPDVAMQIGQRMIETLSAPFELSGRMVSVGVSIGIAVATEREHDVDILQNNADLALYQAKAGGRGKLCVFEPAMAERHHARLQIENDLKSAIERDELAVYYQPIFDLRANTCTGFEALVRWRHASRGFISPAEFIPLAEETGLINSIGAWVLQTACRDATTLPDHIKIAVNLSPVQLQSDDIVQIVESALTQSGLSPSRLELEMTETALLQDNEKTVPLLHQLRDLGLRIALDDFGTGYSSLGYLRTFPFHKLKIDQSFVREMANRADCAAIVGSAVNLAERLGMGTTAEGVETAEQLAMIREIGCTEAQGYLFGRPEPITAARAYFTAEFAAS